MLTLSKRTWPGVVKRAYGKVAVKSSGSSVGLHELLVFNCFKNMMRYYFNIFSDIPKSAIKILI
jgi:hypothetical protein